MRRRTKTVLAVALGIALAALLLVRRDIPRQQSIARWGQPPSQFVDVEGMHVHVRDEGAGPPLVLIHGTSSSLHTWDGWVARLASHRRIVRLDMPGFGLTGAAADGDYRASRLARVVAGVMDRLHVERADVAGNSLGGRVALTLALEHPARVRSLVLLDASGMSGQKPPAIFAFARTPVLGRLLTVVTPRSVVRKNILAVYGDPSRVNDALIDRYWELTLAEGNRRALWERINGPSDPDLDDRLKELHVPTLLEWGERDAWVPLEFGKRMHAGIEGSRLITYPELGHVPMEESPEKTADDADAFLR